MYYVLQNFADIRKRIHFPSIVNITAIFLFFASAGGNFVIMWAGQ